MPRWLNVPNLFTLLRLILVPFILQAIFAAQHWRALELFAVAALTDAIDGAWARHFSVVTPAGAYLDPIADKCLLSSVFLALAMSGLIPWWLVAIVFARDFYILLGAGLLLTLTSVRRFPPSVWGKASTLIQIVAVVVCMVRNSWPNPLWKTLADLMLWPTAAVTLWSGIDYTRRGIQFAKGIDGSSAPE